MSVLIKLALRSSDKKSPVVNVKEGYVNVSNNFLQAVSERGVRAEMSVSR